MHSIDDDKTLDIQIRTCTKYLTMSDIADDDSCDIVYYVMCDSVDDDIGDIVDDDF